MFICLAQTLVVRCAYVGLGTSGRGRTYFLWSAARARGVSFWGGVRALLLVCSVCGFCPNPNVSLLFGSPHYHQPHPPRSANTYPTYPSFLTSQHLPSRPLTTSSFPCPSLPPLSTMSSAPSLPPSSPLSPTESMGRPAAAWCFTAGSISHYRIVPYFGLLSCPVVMKQFIKTLCVIFAPSPIVLPVRPTKYDFPTPD